MKWKTQIYVMKMDKSSVVDNLQFHIQNVKCRYLANSGANMPFLRNSLSELVRHFPGTYVPGYYLFSLAGENGCQLSNCQLPTANRLTPARTAHCWP